MRGAALWCWSGCGSLLEEDVDIFGGLCSHFPGSALIPQRIAPRNKSLLVAI